VKSFLVKHLAYQLGPVKKLYKELSKQPHSYTNNHSLAKAASEGNLIYVIEVEKNGRKTGYNIAYRYNSYNYDKRASGRWLDKFTYKNVSDYSSPIGDYFETPLAILDDDIDIWLRQPKIGMREVPVDLAKKLDEIFIKYNHMTKSF